MVHPALRLHDEEVEERHDGHMVDYDPFPLVDLRELEDRRNEDVNLDAAAVGAPAWKAALEDLVLRVAPPGAFEEVAIIRGDDDLFDPFGDSFGLVVEGI